MNIHCVNTFIILLLAVSLATAQRSWRSVFRYDNYDIPAVIEVPRPRVVHTIYDEFPQPLRRLHLFEPHYPPPQVIYVPEEYLAPEVHVDDLHPNAYNNRFHEPPYLSRLSTALSYTYNIRIVPVINKDETVPDSLPSDSSTVTHVPTNPPNQSRGTKTITTKEDKNSETTDSADQGSVKKATPKPKAKTVTNFDAVVKPDDNETTQSTTKVDANKVSTPNVDGVESKPVVKDTKTIGNVYATSNSTTSKDNSNDGNSVGSTTDADVTAV